MSGFNCKPCLTVNGPLLRRDGKSLESFLEDYFAGRLKRYVKSEPVPAKNNSPVKVSESSFTVVFIYSITSGINWS